MRVFKLAAIVSALVGAACTINQTKAPDLTGPSTFATSLRMTATPDTVVLNGQQSIIMVEARDAAGSPLPGLRVHLDAGGCGQLSSTDVTTGSDGRTAVVFTAPSLPLPMPECFGAAGGVTIEVFSVGNNTQTTSFTSASIRFLTPSSTDAAAVFAVNFTATPSPTAGEPFRFAFDDAGSVSPGHAIPNSGFRWDWSDGATKIGPNVTHDFPIAGTYTATLTITDDIGQSGSKTALLTIR
jgi:hypothetical protein